MTCPFCPALNLVKIGDVFECALCGLRGPRSLVDRIVADRAELALLRAARGTGAGAALNARLKELAEQLRDSARMAGTAAARADGDFDVQATQNHRGRAIAFSDAARRVELLTGEKA